MRSLISSWISIQCWKSNFRDVYAFDIRGARCGRTRSCRHIGCSTTNQRHRTTLHFPWSRCNPLRLIMASAATATVSSVNQPSPHAAVDRVASDLNALHVSSSSSTASTATPVEAMFDSSAWIEPAIVQAHLPAGYRIRPLQIDDDQNGFLTLLAQLTKVGNVTQSMFQGRLSQRCRHYKALQNVSSG